MTPSDGTRRTTRDTSPPPRNNRNPSEGHQRERRGDKAGERQHHHPVRPDPLGSRWSGNSDNRQGSSGSTFRMRPRTRATSGPRTNRRPTARRRPPGLGKTAEERRHQCMTQRAPSKAGRPGTSDPDRCQRVLNQHKATRRLERTMMTLTSPSGIFPG